MKYPYRLIIAFSFILFFVQPVIAVTDLKQVQSLLNDGKLQKALTGVDNILSEDPTNVQARFTRGIILTRMNRLNEAETVFSEIIKDHPNLPEPYNNLAVIYASQGKYEKASEALQKAINTHPSYAIAHENMGDIYAKMASQAYNQALELDNTNETAREKLSLVNELFSIQRTEENQNENQPAKTQSEKQAIIVAEKPEQPANENTTQSLDAAIPPGPEKTSAVKKATESSTSALNDQIRSEVLNTVTQWAKAWSDQDVDAYLSYYAPEYSPDGDVTRQDWIEYRKDRITSPGYIKISLSSIRVAIQGDTLVRASFLQKYESDTYSDIVKKTLILNQIDKQWRIVQEENE